MIKFKFYKTNNKINEVKIKGHALSDVKGKDIVCASVSTALILSTNLIIRFKQKENINFNLDEGYFNLKVIKETKEIENILLNLYYSLKELEKDYPKYITEE